MKNSNGQIILILLLIITVGLGIGLSIIQRSLSDVSTSTRVEQSSRAFSAAEAGLERVLSGGEATFELEKVSVAVESQVIPAVGQTFEYPPINKEEIAHIWLVSPNDLISEQYPSSGLISVYWGENDVSPSDLAAIELSFIYKNVAGSFLNKKFFYDPSVSRRSSNGFSDPGVCSAPPILTSLSATPKTFKCKVTISINDSVFPGLDKLMILRARLLYTSISQPLAVEPEIGKTLPKQARLLLSTGTIGDVQRRIQLLVEDKVVPFYFDYAIFSAGDISK